MKYSVLMSVYKNDNPEFLKQALESIYEKQTRKPDEIIIVFDGLLNDQLYSVLNDFKHGKEEIVRYYPQEINRGLGEALRIGSEKCTGDYIFRMDSDDISVPDRFEKQIEYVESNPEVAVIGTDITEFSVTPDEENVRKRICPAAHEDIVFMAKKRSPMNHVTVCIKREALMGCGGYESILLLEDYYLWLKMIAKGYKLANINETLVYVRAGSAFGSRRGDKQRIVGWKKVQQFMIANGIVTKSQACKNMITIRLFVYTPRWLKSFLYRHFLRKK